MNESGRTPDERPPMAALWGLAGEFDKGSTLLAALQQARAAGYRKVEAYSPLPIEGLEAATGFRAGRIPWLTLAGAILGGGLTLLGEWWVSAVDWQINIGGRPLAAWPAFMIPAFEISVLFATLFAIGGLLVANGLPRLHHPIFSLPRFGLATEDRFFLCIEASDPAFDAAATRAFLESLGPRRIDEVPA